MAGNIKVPAAYLYEVRSRSTVKLTICTLYSVHICILKYVGVSFFSLQLQSAWHTREVNNPMLHRPRDNSSISMVPPTSSPWIARYLVQYRGTIIHFKSNCIY